MKSNILTLVLAVGTFGLCGCDETAQSFATKTLNILERRSADLSAKVGAEKTAYARWALHAAEDDRALVDSTLQNERNERSSILAADYDEGRKPVSQWRKDLAEYGRVDYEANMEMFSAGLDGSSQYLQAFESLKVEQDKVDALTKLLGALTKKQSMKADVEALGKFAEDSSKEFNKKVCTQVKTDQSSADATVKAAADAAFKTRDCATVLK